MNHFLNNLPNVDTSFNFPTSSVHGAGISFPESSFAGTPIATTALQDPVLSTMAPPTQVAQHRSTTADMIQAANNLLSFPISNQAPHFSAAGSPALSAGAGFLHRRSQSQSQSDATSPRGHEDYSEQHEQVLTELVGLSSPQSARKHPPRSLSNASDVQFGTDPCFAHNQPSFIPPSTCETSESMVDRTMKLLRCLEPNSAETTRQPSPTAESPGTTKRSIAKGAPQGAPPLTHPQTSQTAHTERGEPPTKRIRTPERDDDTGLVPAHRCVSGDGPQDGTAAAIARRRNRKAKAALAKAKRTPLTAEQKRLNHNESEKRRREYIAKGYEAIRTVRPGYDGKNKSKAVVVEEAATFLRTLLIENGWDGVLEDVPS